MHGDAVYRAGQCVHAAPHSGVCHGSGKCMRPEMGDPRRLCCALGGPDESPCVDILAGERSAPMRFGCVARTDGATTGAWGSAVGHNARGRAGTADAGPGGASLPSQAYPTPPNTKC